jgi:tetratricopeptide (TPR) repeat protein
MARSLSRYRFHDIAGRLLLKARLARLALPFLERSLELNPQLGVQHSRRARALLALGRWEEAALGFQAAVVLDPESVHAWTNLASALVSLSRWEEAAVVCQRASALGSRRQPQRPLPRSEPEP